MHTPLSLSCLTSFSLVVAMLSSCAPSVHLDQPDIRLPAKFVAPSTASTDHILSLDRWWEDFHDPQLSSLIETALERSTTARLAFAKIAEAQAVRRQTRATTSPTGSMTGNATEQHFFIRCWDIWRVEQLIGQTN